jgi:hypothetical protein
MRVASERYMQKRGPIKADTVVMTDENDGR